MNARELLVEFYNPADDELGVAHMDDTRRPRLTLMHLQHLRKARDTERVDRAQHLEFLPDMYAPAPEEAAGGMPPM